MTLWERFFRKTPGTADVARERLQIILTHERASRNDPDFLPRLQKDLLAVISRYIEIGEEHLKVAVQRDGKCAMLEINIEMPPRI